MSCIHVQTTTSISWNSAISLKEKKDTEFFWNSEMCVKRLNYNYVVVFSLIILVKIRNSIILKFLYNSCFKDKIPWNSGKKDAKYDILDINKNEKQFLVMLIWILKNDIVNK